jgi:Ca2+-binding RTX toxin-like protein
VKRTSVSLATLMFVVLVVSISDAAPTCTDIGTPERDSINGDANRDVICLKGGRDYGNGRGAADIVRGGSGQDTLVGGAGVDVIRGGDGDDDLFAVDDNPGDKIRAGAGFDNCYADVGDDLIGCEHRVRVS